MSWMKTLFLPLRLQLRLANSFTHQDLRSRRHLRVVDLFTHMHARITQAPRRNYHLHLTARSHPLQYASAETKYRGYMLLEHPLSFLMSLTFRTIRKGCQIISIIHCVLF